MTQVVNDLLMSHDQLRLIQVQGVMEARRLATHQITFLTAIGQIADRYKRDSVIKTLCGGDETLLDHYLRYVDGGTVITKFFSEKNDVTTYLDLAECIAGSVASAQVRPHDGLVSRWEFAPPRAVTPPSASVTFEPSGPAVSPSLAPAFTLRPVLSTPGRPPGVSSPISIADTDIGPS